MTKSVQFPFYTRRSYQALGFEVPNRSAICAVLAHSQAVVIEPIPEVLVNYQRYYGIDQLPAEISHHLLHSGSYQIHVLYLRSIQPQKMGSVFVLHGYLEHAALYWPLYQQLLSQGCDVIVPDLPGHGLSSGVRAGIASFANYQQMLTDLGVFARQMSACEPWLGIGQSTGGAIWLEHISQCQVQQKSPLIMRVFLCSPLIRPTRAGWWQNRLGIFVLSLFRHRVPRLFRTNNHHLAFLTFVRDEDPLQMRMLHLSWVRALAEWLSTFERIEPCLLFPVWMAQGLLDNTVDWRFNNHFIRTHFRVVRYLRLTNCSHQLINEVDKRRALVDAAIDDFLLNQPVNLG